MDDKTYKELLTHFDSVEQIDELLGGLAAGQRGAEKQKALAARVRFREKVAEPPATFLDGFSCYLIARRGAGCL